MLSNIIKNVFLGEYQLEGSIYKCYEISRNSAVIIDAQVYDADRFVDKISVCPFTMREYSIKVEKFVNGQLIASDEFVTGISSSTVRRAFIILSKHLVGLNHIEEALYEHGLPYQQGFLDCATKAIKNCIKHTRPELIPYAIKQNALRVDLIPCQLVPKSQQEEALTQVAAAR